MTSFPLWYLLLPFAAVCLLAILFFFFNIFHLNRYAIKSPATSFVMGMYVFTFIALLLGSGLYLLSVNWHKRIQPSDLIPSFQASNRI